MKFKQASYQIKDFDEKQGIVKAYANAYNNEDADEDISAPGSFNKTVRENKKRIRVLKDHNSTITLGVPLEIDPDDSFGLLTVTKFNLQKEVSRDMFSDIELAMQNDLNSELSIGYKTIKRDEKNSKIITEYKLYEYSFLSSWAANELATVQGLKNIKSHYGILSLIEKAYNLNYSDTRLKQIENLLVALSKDKPLPSDTSKDEPRILAIKQFTNSLKN